MNIKHLVALLISLMVFAPVVGYTSLRVAPAIDATPAPAACVIPLSESEGEGEGAENQDEEYEEEEEPDCD